MYYFQDLSIIFKYNHKFYNFYCIFTKFIDVLFNNFWLFTFEQSK
jgi:hypothetical protein